MCGKPYKKSVSKCYVDVRELIWKHAVKNALDYGKADVKAVVGKVIAEAPELKKSVKEWIGIAKELVGKANTLTREELEREVSKYSYEKRKEERKGLPPLPDVRDRVVTRFAPEPGGYIHLGNLRAALVNYLYAEMYGGEFILRFDDTNPYKAKRVYYDAIQEDLESLGIKVDRVVRQSERMEVYYEMLRSLLESNKAYASFESPESVNEKRKRGEPFEGRERSVEENLEIMDRVLEGEYREGEVAFFLKVDPSHPNPVLRDPGIARIVDRVPHPFTGWKYRLYPLYNFASAVDDGTMGITHVLRGKDHENNGKVQSLIQEYLGLEKPVVVAFGRLVIDESEYAVGLSKRRIREALVKGEIGGWDDPRTLTVRALLKRGILPETFREFFTEIGAKKTDINLRMENLYSLNRKRLDPIARRVFFVEDPVEVRVEGLPSKEVHMAWHPERDMGERVYRVDEDTVLLVEREDLEGVIRLKHLARVRVEEKRVVYLDDTVGRERKVHWVPREGSIRGVVVFPNGTEREGFLEPWAQLLKEGEIVQLDRKFFARVERNEGEVITFLFTHR